MNIRTTTAAILALTIGMDAVADGPQGEANAAEQNTDADIVEELRELFGLDTLDDDVYNPSAYCTSNADGRRAKREKRRIYLTLVFNVDVADWHNVNPIVAGFSGTMSQEPRGTRTWRLRPCRRS